MGLLTCMSQSYDDSSARPPTTPKGKQTNKQTTQHISSPQQMMEQEWGLFLPSTRTCNDHNYAHEKAVKIAHARDSLEYGTIEFPVNFEAS